VPDGEEARRRRGKDEEEEIAMTAPTRPVVAVGVLLLDGDQVLLVQRAKPPAVGRWTVPGGKVELGETLEEAALRELGEETGLNATLGPVVEILDRVVRGDDGAIEYHYVILDFLGHSPQGTLAAASDSLDARWVEYAELERYPLTDGLRAVIDRARAMQASAAPGPVRATEREH
jgi:ADP-ribose pyrophosphatase YjhB (NUDIX family)